MQSYCETKLKEKEIKLWSKNIFGQFNFRTSWSAVPSLKKYCGSYDFWLSVRHRKVKEIYPLYFDKCAEHKCSNVNVVTYNKMSLEVI